MPLHTLSILLDHPRKVYHQGERLIGLLVIENKYELKHEGIQIAIEGLVDIHFNLGATSFLDTFSRSNKSIELINCSLDLAKSGRLMPGKTEIPFQLSIGPTDYQRLAPLYETYHGVFISVRYCVKCFVKRPFLTRDLVEFVEFFIEYDANPIGAPVLVKQPINFEITPDSLSSTRRDIIPDFKITGHLDSSIWRLSEPLTGEFTIEYCESVIRSVDLQLVRVERYGTSPIDKEFSRESTEVQNIQIGDGNILRKAPIPIYMIFPKLFTVPTLITSKFRIGKHRFVSN